jgi:hypothetical protein
MIFVFVACKYSKQASIIKIPNHSLLGGDAFYKQAAAMKWKERDSLVCYRTIWVNKRPKNHIQVLQDISLKILLCDEELCDFYRY